MPRACSGGFDEHALEHFAGKDVRLAILQAPEAFSTLEAQQGLRGAVAHPPYAIVQERQEPLRVLLDA